ncbi:mitochondrial acyl-CoA dehydrogenase family member (short/branched chain acyl-CoA dehydrogenase) [Andalucia godoyi]|uniref:Short/branched chain specific acyl-CoA dehydrogenase, mitochondrial n=1 Tax=Andalucia godoyi TaxID=505711 RepID=A0A8K0AIP0_ANDGO|nr:mitochondrial acyl-CoA dehydrogenase family member (short/branched chain acyl-CoA dehydrogenase) [Andalucia godoyi]|eukprot:ANDGO_03063.mRNA.1 mitochondrial acyl-CoA dehydrogenase family member (short/branched chain acyl-CoA dehydrogenase)
MLSRFVRLGSRQFFSTATSPFQPLVVFSEENEALRESVSRFALERVGPKVKQMDRDQKLDESLLKELFDQGYMGIETPAELGGAGLNLTSTMVVVEELAKIDPAVAVVVDVQNTLVNPIVKTFGTDKQKQEWLPKLATGTLGSFCLSEASSGSDAFALKTTAVDKGDHWELNGSKMWITNSKEAGLFLIFATVNPAAGYKGITAFLAGRDTPGLRVGKSEDKLGIRASSTCEVIFEGMKLPKDAVLGKVGEGYKVAIGTLNIGRIGIGAQMLGLAQGAFDYAMPYLHERKQFGKYIADFQGMQLQYAEAATMIHGARLMVYEAARLHETGRPFVQEAAMAKWNAAQVASHVSRRAIEWLGGVGFTKEFDAEKFYRDSVIGQIYEGTSNINLETIAKNIQKKYRQ